MKDHPHAPGMVAERFGVDAAPPDPGDKVGIARNVRFGLLPLNALRHAPEGGTSGWYIWAGEDWSDNTDFFLPLHISHLSSWCPQILPYLSLPPGWRVLLAPGHEDVWFDETLVQEPAWGPGSPSPSGSS